MHTLKNLQHDFYGVCDRLTTINMVATFVATIAYIAYPNIDLSGTVVWYLQRTDQIICNGQGRIIVADCGTNFWGTALLDISDNLFLLALSSIGMLLFLSLTSLLYKFTKVQATPRMWAYTAYLGLLYPLSVLFIDGMLIGQSSPILPNIAISWQMLFCCTLIILIPILLSVPLPSIGRSWRIGVIGIMLITTSILGYLLWSLDSAQQFGINWGLLFLVLAFLFIVTNSWLAIQMSAKTLI